jgi:hypothetical protein
MLGPKCGDEETRAAATRSEAMAYLEKRAGEIARQSGAAVMTLYHPTSKVRSEAQQLNRLASTSSCITFARIHRGHNSSFHSDALKVSIRCSLFFR